MFCQDIGQTLPRFLLVLFHNKFFPDSLQTFFFVLFHLFHVGQVSECLSNLESATQAATQAVSGAKTFVGVWSWVLNGGSWSIMGSDGSDGATIRRTLRNWGDVGKRESSKAGDMGMCIGLKWFSQHLASFCGAFWIGRMDRHLRPQPNWGIWAVQGQKVGVQKARRRIQESCRGCDCFIVSMRAGKCCWTACNAFDSTDARSNWVVLWPSWMS